MKNTQSTACSLVLSYLGLRKAIGIIAVALPFVLALGKAFVEGPGILPSISDYYYTAMRNIFVGSLCSIGMFLMSYRGYGKKDNLAGNLACLFVVGVALCPTAPGVNPSAIEVVVGYVHYGLAAAFFLVLAYFSLVLFRKTAPDKPMTPQKKQRNRIYLLCGIIILTCLALIAINALFLRHTFMERLDPVFWLEATAVIAFGISWLTKGEAILGDSHETCPAGP